jgi:hypothetical protein
MRPDAVGEAAAEQHDAVFQPYAEVALLHFYFGKEFHTCKDNV